MLRIFIFRIYGACNQRKKIDLTPLGGLASRNSFLQNEMTFVGLVCEGESQKSLCLHSFDY